MARRGRRRGGNSFLRRYGYPSNKSLRQQAADFAGASVPTVKSINRQYDRSQRDATGFTDALLSALQSVNQGVGSAYDTAQQQQGALDAATQARLGALAPEYAAGTQATVGGLGDSASAHLVASGAAERVAGAKQPGIAAGMGFLAHAGLTADQEEALRRRQEAYRASYAQILQQVQQNAETRAMAQAQFQQQSSQFAQQMAFNQQQFAEGQRQFNISSAQSDAHFWANLKAQYNGASATSGGRLPKNPWKAYNMTPTQWNSATKDALDQANQAANQGISPQQFVDELTRVGNVPGPIAIESVRRIYGALRPVNPAIHPKLAKAYAEFHQWLLEQRSAYENAHPRRTRKKRRQNLGPRE